MLTRDRTVRGENGNSEIRHTPVRGEGTGRERARGEIFGATEDSSRLGVPTMRGSTADIARPHRPIN